MAVPGFPRGGGAGHRAQTFRDPSVVVVIVWALLMLVILRVLGELGKRVDQ